MVRRLSLFVGLTALAAALGACSATVSSVTVERTIEQSALLPPLTGPRATGALTTDGLFSFEAAYVVDPVVSQRGARWEGAPGELAIEHEVRLRFAYGISDRVELGASVGLATADWSRGRGADTSDQDLDSFLAHGGPTARFVFVRNERLSFGAVVELDFASVPYVASVYEKAWYSETTVSIGPWWLDVSQRNQYIGDRTRYRPGSVFFPNFKGGLFLAIHADEAWTVNLGALGQNALSFVGAETVRFTCVGEGVTASECAERRAPDLPRTEVHPVLTMFASASFRVDPMVFTAQLFAHPAAPDDLRDTTPFGADIAVRVEF